MDKSPGQPTGFIFIFLELIKITLLRNRTGETFSLLYFFFKIISTTLSGYSISGSRSLYHQ